MKPMGKVGDGKSRKVTPPTPSYMSNDQFVNYLSELRSNRTSRPGGARPPPSGARPGPSRASTGRHSLGSPSQTDSVTGTQRAPSQAPSTGAGSISSRYSTASGRGRDYYPDQSTRQPLKPSEVVPSATYMERGQRWMEKEEAFSLRGAMDEMDIQDRGRQSPDEDDSRLYNAALDEAAELVWQHENGGNVPRPDGPYRYRPHLREKSYAHARTASVGTYGEDIAPSGLARGSGSRSVSGSSTDSDSGSRRSRPSLDAPTLGHQSTRKSKPYGSVGSSRPGNPVVENRRRSSMKRNISGEVERPFSGDQIWEEPETASTSSEGGRASPNKLASKTQNPMSSVRFEQAHGEVGAVKPRDRVEIYRNPPTQSRSGQYTTNTPSPVAEPAEDAGEAEDAEGSPKKRNGKEIRSQDIRDATSMRIKDRSARLPEPTAVSDTPGRPIVSFDANWRAPDESTDVNPDRHAARGSAAASADAKPMVIPTITVAEDPAPRSSRPPPVPSISVAGPDEQNDRPLPSINVPTIAVDDAPDNNTNSSTPTIVAPGEDSKAARGSSRPLPTPGAKGAAPRKAQRPRGHWSPAPGAAGRSTTICHECGFPIEGRFVALAGISERFHPQCFQCYTCGTGLEAMEIHPEPEQMRTERLDRIRRREAGEVLDEEPGMTLAEDGDDRLRFYCHLDYHELFAPRCKHCHTPILGEHIVALGQHWHYGHFFCAECGDPFEHGMTHIEKDGYAWCVNCQTRRTERRAPKCKKCRAAVIGQYVQALGGEWHESCFRCAECQGGFDDGQIFPKDVGGGATVVLCTDCRMRELKM